MPLLMALVMDCILACYVAWRPRLWQSCLLLLAVGLLAVLTR